MRYKISLPSTCQNKASLCSSVQEPALNLSEVAADGRASQKECFLIHQTHVLMQCSTVVRVLCNSEKVPVQKVTHFWSCFTAKLSLQIVFKANFKLLTLKNTAWNRRLCLVHKPSMFAFRYNQEQSWKMELKNLLEEKKTHKQRNKREQNRVLC